MNRLVINGRFLAQPVTGVQRVARELVRAMDLALADGEWAGRWRAEVVAPPDAGDMDEPLRRIAVRRIGRLRGHAWEQLELPRASAGALLLNLGNTGPLRVARQGVFIHDAGVWANAGSYSRSFRAYYRFLLPRLARRAELVVTNSHFSARELARCAGIHVRTDCVIPLGADHVGRVAADGGVFDRLRLPPRDFVLLVGAAAPHKNAGVVLDALRSLGEGAPPLVLAGSRAHAAFAATVAPARAGVAVHETGQLTDGELRALYEAARCLVFPSLYEGFGLPALEAMASGCPAVVSTAGALPEVCGDGALHCSPEAPAEWARAIRAAAEPGAEREALLERGRARAATYRWAASARALLQALGTPASHGGCGPATPSLPTPSAV